MKLGLAAAFVAVLAGCGGRSATGRTTHAAQVPAQPSGKQFPVFRAVMDGGIDYLDPGLSYTTEGAGVLWNVYLPLLGYKHVSGPDGGTLVPYLARALPTISRDGRTYTLRLRSGLLYSNGRPVLASDFKATIARDRKLDSPGVAFFANVASIDTSDRTGEIVIKLKTPEADFANVLATEFAALVPASSPASDSSTRPLPATGPYLIESYAPGTRIVEVRNPHFSAAQLDGNVPAGNPDRIVWDVVNDDALSLARVLASKDDWDGYHSIPPRRLADVEKRHATQLRTYLSPNTYYFFINTEMKPFTSVYVRRAVNYAIDRKALVQVYDGLATPTENVLPRGEPQFTAHHFYPYDLARAKRLVKRSGFAGTRVTVWAHKFGPDQQAAEYLGGVLNAIGLRTHVHVIGGSDYWIDIAKPSNNAQIGFADWFQDYPHPLSSFASLLDGAASSSNYANFDDPIVNAKIAQLRREPRLTPAVNRAWAQLDAQVMRQAPWAPFLNRRFTDVFAPSVDLSCYVNNLVYGFDYTQICMKAP